MNILIFFLISLLILLKFNKLVGKKEKKKGSCLFLGMLEIR